MTPPMTTDLLELAEAVAGGDNTLAEAQGRLDAADAAELARLVGAVSAVRDHARALGSLADGASRAGLQAPLSPVLSPGSTGGVAARVAAGQRVTRGPVRLGGGRRTQSGRKAPRWILVAAALAVGGGVLAASGLVGGRPMPTPPIPPAPTEDNVVAIGPSPTSSQQPTVVPSRVTVPALGLDVLNDLSSVQMRSATVGWASTSKAILRTEDGGRTWFEVLATRASFTRFVDESTAAFVDADSLDTIVVTHDGGRSWGSVTVKPPAGSSAFQLTFRSADIGYATFAMGPDGPASLAVFATTDGGATWTGPVFGDESTLPSFLGKPDAQGGAAGLVWAWPPKYDNRPYDNRFSLSADGGATWVVRPFPTDRLLRTNDLKQPESIVPGEAGQLVMVLNDVPAIFGSRDDGRTWTRIRAWPAFVVIELRSVTEWTAVALDGSFIDATTDAGATWRHTVATQPISLNGVGVEVSFGSSEVGLLLDARQRHVCHLESFRQSPNPNPSCAPGQPLSVLSVTSDGGRTWTQVLP